MPLKEISRFADDSDSANFHAFAEQGRKLAENKINSIENALKFLDDFEETMNTSQAF